MSRTLRTARHEAMCAFLVSSRKRASLTQAEVARRLGRYQSFVADIERGQRRVDLVEFLEFADVLGFDASDAVKKIAKQRP